MRVRREGGLLVPVPESEDSGKVPATAQPAEAQVHEPAKLLRIALMLKELQNEVRAAGTDEAGRERLREIYERAMRRLAEVLSPELQQELAQLTIPFERTTPSESEVRIAQAQLIGWLEGLFQGIQMAIFNQQMAARQQLQQMRGRRQREQEEAEERSRSHGYL